MILATTRALHRDRRRAGDLLQDRWLLFREHDLSSLARHKPSLSCGSERDNYDQQAGKALWSQDQCQTPKQKSAGKSRQNRQLHPLVRGQLLVATLAVFVGEDPKLLPG
jgi:hypothetical protein